MKEMRVSSPKSIVQLVEALASSEGKYLLLAGCTDLLVNMRKHLAGCELLIDLSGINEMRYIRVEDKDLIIGALTTFTQITEAGIIREHALCLAQAAGSVGSPQIRNRATIGGNIANGSPAADSVPALLALDAWIRYIDSEGNTYKAGLEEFLEKHRGLIKSRHAFIECIGIPLERNRSFSGFKKLGSRSEVSISKLSLALAFSADDEGAIGNARLGIGSVGKTAVRIPEAERLMEGRIPDEQLIRELGLLLSEKMEEMLRGRASMPYKKKAVAGLVRDLLEK